jgi:hypothetical protein
METKRLPRLRHCGVALLVVLGVLAVLALLATTFATLQATERHVSRNYLDTVRARLAAESGFEHAVASLQQSLARPFPDPRLPETRTWVYFGSELKRTNPPKPQTPLEIARNPSFPYLDQGIQDPSRSDAVPKQIRIEGTPTGFSGSVGGTYGVHGDLFSLRVEDLSGRIYVNDGIDQGSAGSVSQNLRRILDCLGQVIGCAGLGGLIVDRRPPQGYRTAADLERALPADVATKALPFLTVAGWVDSGVANPVPLSAAQLRDYPIKYHRGNPPLFRQGRGVDVWGKRVPGDLVAFPTPGDGPLAHAVYAMDELNPQWIELVSRAPVNVNQASREVLIALLSDLQGFFISYRRRNNIEPAHVGGYWYPAITHTFSPAGWPALQVPTEGDEYGFLYKTLPFKYVAGTTSGGDWVDAARVAQEIVDCRERRGDYANVPFGGPFKTWRQFNAFCDNLVRIKVLEDRRPIFYDYQSSGPDVVKPGNITGYGPLVASDYERQWASQALADLLKANFNPNLHLNELNPDANLHLLVDKTDLFVNSTEFIFTPTGFYEIESIGRILRPVRGEDTFQAPDCEVVAVAKIKAGIQLFEIHRETSQSRFARGKATPSQGTRATNSGASLEVGPEPDNGPAPLENEWDGYIALPTIGGLKIPKAPGEALRTPERAAESGESIGVHFQYDFDCYHHADGIREELSRVERAGEAVMNFPDPSESHGGPYDPLQGGPGHHRLSRSFRMPGAGSGTAAPPSLSPYGPLDLRVDGGYVERHAAPAWWISPKSFAPNMKEMNVVTSFWVKPSYPPDRSGKPRLLVNASRRAPHDGPRGGVSVIDQAGFLLLFNAGHENAPSDPSMSENMTLCGEPQWWDPKLFHYGHEPFRPQSFIFGRGYGKVIFDPTHPRFYDTCQVTVNHQGHADSDQRSYFREHRWTHLTLVSRTRPLEGGSSGGWANAYDPPRWTMILVNGRQLKGTMETLFLQDGYNNGDANTDFTVHRNGDRNSIRFGMPSQVTSDGPFSGNFSCDATIDEFMLWNSSNGDARQKAVRGYLDGRYAKPLRQTEDPLASEGVFISAEIDLPPAARGLPPPASGPGSGAGLTTTVPSSQRELIGIACTAYGEDSSDPAMKVTDEATGAAQPVRILTYLKLGSQLSGPYREDAFTPTSVRLPDGEKFQYLVRFEIGGLDGKSILLTTPVVDDVTLYVKPAGGARTLYYHMDLVGGGL